MHNVKIKDLEIGDVINMTLYGNGDIRNVVNGKLLSIVSGQLLREPVNASLNHANIFPLIPTNLNIIDNFRSYNYLIVELNNDLYEIGIPWVQLSSLQRNIRGQAIVKISDFDHTRLTDLVNVLNRGGFSNNTITMI